jgi:hypothetical protein
VDQPNTRDFQFLISDGETFCHEEKRDLEHQLEYPERDCPFYRLINTERNGRYQLIKQVITDPHRSVLLVHTKLEVFDKSLRGKLKLYALLAPHLARYGAGNSGSCCEISGLKLLRAERGDTHLVMGCSTGFSHRSVGYVGASDGWQDLMDNFKMDWEFCAAENGNIALTGEINLQQQDEFTIGIALGGSSQSTGAKLLQSLAEPFDVQRESYVHQWQRTVVNPKFDFAANTSDGGHIYRLSRCVLLAHEDKNFEGALVASMSIPWGETKDDNDLGGYHLVWTRDLVQSATALLASDYVNHAFAEADLVIAVGYDVVEYAPKSWNPKRDKKIVHVDMSPAEVDAAYIVNVGVVGDIASSLDAMAQTAKPHSTVHGTQFRQMLHDELEQGRNDSSFPLKPQRILADLRSALADDDIVISDAGAHKLWLARLFPCFQPNTCIISNGFAAMGMAVPGAVAAKLVHPNRRVVAVTGDGGFLMNSQELETAVRLETPFVVLVLNDRSYGLIRWKQMQQFGRPAFVDFNNPDLVKYAESFGALGMRIGSADELVPALRTALNSNKLTIIDCPVDASENLRLTQRLAKLTAEPGFQS